MRYFLDPFGCAKNQVDAENMMAHLNNAGWSAVDSENAINADLIIINSCGFIQSAKQESINAVLAWRRQYPGKKILLAGCLAQRYAQELSTSLPEADGFFGINDITKIVDTAEAIVGNGEDALLSACEPSVRCSLLPVSSRPLLSPPGSAYIKISEGCNNRCSYCAIPLIRGPLRCRSIADITEECRGLIARGIKELCIIGQDIGSYSDNGSGLPQLLRAVAEIPGKFWVRLLYMHPGHFPLPIIDIMENDRRFLPYFDIPFQHASTRILSAMNRQGSAQEYIALASVIRGRLPAAVIRTTVLVGFPGETNEDFNALLDFQAKLRPDWLGCFAYSREEDTPAYTMKGQVHKKTAAERKRTIEERQMPITEANMDRFTGQTLDMLLEEQRPNPDVEAKPGTIWLGRLYCHAPEVDGIAVIPGSMIGAVRAGDILSCKVTARHGFDLMCRIAE